MSQESYVYLHLVIPYKTKDYGDEIFDWNSFKIGACVGEGDQTCKMYHEDLTAIQYGKAGMAFGFVLILIILSWFLNSSHFREINFTLKT